MTQSPGSLGNDTIIGAAGNDVLNGGDGNDVFVVAASAGTDTITGGLGTDLIRASAANVAISFGTWDVEEISGGGFSNVRIVVLPRRTR
jgi:Ca2+-binding RTX toxin-like protein